ncbi:MAG: M20/M25/M40 family metallo-hydrolase [Nocardioidaceae bacterium]|nr:M20/M25/M40 family metallo-hydrolase [Nocardioidaceae bacterium]
MRALERWVADHLEAVVEDVADLARVESGSSDLDDLRAAVVAIEALFERHLGAPDRRVLHDGGERGDVLVLEHGATDGGDGPPVLVLCHYDTVWPHGTLAGWPVTRTGDRLEGPGVFDMKAGLVFGVWALAARRAAGLATPRVRFVLNGDEETGSLASRPHIEAAAADARWTLVLEPSSGGRVKTRRKGVGLFDVRADGVSAHAGLEPEKGASAVHALAAVVTELVALADPAAGTTVNVGLVEGGSGRNVVAQRASIGVDVRIADPAETARLDDAFARIRPADDRVTLTWSGGWNRPPMTLNDASAALLDRARAIADDLGHPLQDVGVGGASDANFVSALGGGVLDGLGAVGDGAHARHEHLDVPSVPRQVAVIAGLMGG